MTSMLITALAISLLISSARHILRRQGVARTLFVYLKRLCRRLRSRTARLQLCAAHTYPTYHPSKISTPTYTL